ncbi:protein APCDD1-like [Thalassophryne amazonica]|uniref:protein APCDD1-like n=1 Tax=Thalassophryne amazonica TaxID=390379 RepID=UPI0014710A75|nr:protein APCDD1-like [Thalassophryne amazonica]XP_034021918.1 protein APCDD1-like [Thalassophryne amazonica]XP_034021919.1 protein APCDD1-like [Thalassophryne amazonica]
MKSAETGNMSNVRFNHLLRGACLMWFWQAVFAFETGNKLWEVPTPHFASSSYHNASWHWEPYSECHHLMERARISADIPPRLDGTWVSTRCEIRPGPEFLTRSYTFHTSRQFRALQHYYTDSNCEAPIYSLIIKGRIRLRQASWITHGGTEGEHHLSKVGIVVHSLTAMQRLASRLPQICVDLTLSRMVPGKLHEMYNTRAGRGCLVAMGFSMMEMGLIRVETRHHYHGGKVQELFLGDIHTDWTQRTHYRPTGYQQPLQNAMHHIHPCPVCALVYRSSEHRPPLLSHSPTAPLSLDGLWVSHRCEARPAVLFLTREFTFKPNKHAWEGTYRHYSDPACSQPTFTLRASGHYAQGNPSPKVSGAVELVFKVTQVKVTALEASTAKMLNRARPGKCGWPGDWEIGVERDLAPTDGCTVLGIKLPHKEYELFKTELNHRKNLLLFTGERPTDGSNPDRPQRRPTSFQAPMVLCSERETPPTYGSGFNSKQVQSTASGTERLAELVILVFGLTMFNYFCVY